MLDPVRVARRIDLGRVLHTLVQVRLSATGGTKERCTALSSLRACHLFGCAVGMAGSLGTKDVPGGTREMRGTREMHSSV